MMQFDEPSLGRVILHGDAVLALSDYAKYFKIDAVSFNGDLAQLTDCQTRHVVDYPSNDAVAIVTDDTADAALQNWLNVEKVTIPVVGHGPKTPELLADLSKKLRGAARLNADLMRRLAELRAVHEEVQNNYNSLRNFVCDNGLMPPALGFVNLPDADGGVTLPSDVQSVMQPFPVDFRSMCGFALFLSAPVPLFSKGTLHVELLAAEDEDVVLTWHVDYQKLTQGWVTFAFEQSERFWPTTPQLQLRFETAVEPPPLFSLAPLQLRTDKSATINDKQAMRSLAFKTWKSIPGAPLSVTSQMWPTIRVDQKCVTQIELSVNGEWDVKKVPGQQESCGFELVTLLPDQGRLQVHPLENLIAVAVVQAGVPVGTDTILAEVETANDQASIIEYAVAVLPPADFLAIGTDGSLPPSALISDWTRLPPLTRGFVRLDLPNETYEKMDLLLLTRLPEEGNSSFGWAQFLKLTFKGQFY